MASSQRPQAQDRLPGAFGRLATALTPEIEEACVAAASDLIDSVFERVGFVEALVVRLGPPEC